MAAPKKMLSVAIDRERKVAHITITHDDGARFEGDYCEEDARTLTGPIVNCANFLDIIEDLARLDNPDCTLESSSYSSKTIIKLHAVATVGRVSLADDIDIICPRVATGDAHVAIEKYRAELAERDARIMTLERDLARVSALAEFTMRWGSVPSVGAELWMHIVNRELSGNPITFPMIGREFIMIGDKIIRCNYPGVKSRCIYCVSERQIKLGEPRRETNNFGLKIGCEKRDGTSLRSTIIPATIDITREMMLEHVTVAMVEIGDGSYRNNFSDNPVARICCPQSRDGILQVEPQLFLGMTIPPNSGAKIIWLAQGQPEPIAPHFLEAQRMTSNLQELVDKCRIAIGW